MWCVCLSIVSIVHSFLHSKEQWLRKQLKSMEQELIHWLDCLLQWVMMLMMKMISLLLHHLLEQDHQREDLLHQYYSNYWTPVPASVAGLSWSGT